MENQQVTMTKTQIKQEAKRNHLIQAALELFNSEGYHQTRIEDIIKKAQVGKGTFYLYFKNKEELVMAIMDQLLGEVSHTLDWVQLNIGDVNDLRHLFLEEAKRLTHTFYQNQESARFLFREGRAVSRLVEKRINDYMKAMQKTSEETYQFGLTLGILNNIDPTISSTLVVGGIMHIYQQWLEGNVEQSIDEIIEKSVDFYMSALKLT